MMQIATSLLYVAACTTWQYHRSNVIHIYVCTLPFLPLHRVSSYHSIRNWHSFGLTVFSNFGKEETREYKKYQIIKELLMGERCDVGKHCQCRCQYEDKFSTLGLHFKGEKKRTLTLEPFATWNSVNDYIDRSVYSILQTTVTVTVTCFFFPPLRISESFGFSSVQYDHDCHGFVG